MWANPWAVAPASVSPLHSRMVLAESPATPTPDPEQPSGKHFNFLPASQGPDQGREELHEAQVVQKRHMESWGAHLGSEVVGL